MQFGTRPHLALHIWQSFQSGPGNQTSKIDEQCKNTKVFGLSICSIDK